MSDFWYPYAGQADAVARLTAFATRQFGQAIGITWSDGQQIAMLRRPAMNGTYGTVLNVVRTHVATAPPAAKANHDSTFLTRARALFWHVMEVEGQTEIANAQAQLAGSEAIAHWVQDDVWGSAHHWAIGHKKTADGIGLAIDAIGVGAAAIFVVTFAPEIGALAIATGLVAGAGSVLLFAADGAIFATEMLGYKGISEEIENNRYIQWTRIIATGMTLVDIPVGGARALTEVGKLSRETENAAALAKSGESSAEAARARIAKIAHPSRHAAPVARRTRQLNRILSQVEEHHQAATRAANQAQRIRYFDAPAVFGATPAGAALIGAAPPSMTLTTKQRERDESYLKLLQPEGGMPSDVKLEMRTSAVGKVPHDH